MKRIFISDLHLSKVNSPLTSAFIWFARNTCENIDELYILGDLFEAWLGDDDDSDIAKVICSELKVLSERGVTLYFQAGNRDFLVGKKFTKRTGAIILPDEKIINIHQETVLLMHGDKLCTDDIDYQKFRKRIQSPISKFTLRCLSLNQRKKIAEKLRGDSSAANQQKTEDIMDVNADSVLATMNKHGATTLIHGHTHRPNIHAIQTPNGFHERLVLGDWGEKMWWAETTENGIKLRSRPIKEIL